MGNWHADLRDCVVDPDTGALARGQWAGIGDSSDGHAWVRGAVTPRGTLAIVAMGHLVWALHVDASGRIEDTGATPVPIDDEAWYVALHPVWQVAYVVTSSTIYAFRFNADGTLTSVAGSPFPIRAGTLAFRPDGAFAYARVYDPEPNDDRRSSLAIVRVKKSGALAVGTTYPLGRGEGSPGWGDLVIDRTGAFLITLDMAVYRIDPDTGRLSLVFSSPNEAVTLAAHPEQDLIFAARTTGEYSRQLETMRLDLASGALSVASTVEMDGPHHGFFTFVTVEPMSHSLYHVATNGTYEGIWIKRYAIRPDGSLGPPKGSGVLDGYSYPGDFVPFAGPRN